MKSMKKGILYVICVALAVGFLPPAMNVSAVAPQVTDEQMEKILDGYNAILEDVNGEYEEVDGCGFVAESFDLKDLDVDGIPELIINQDVPQIFTYNLKDDMVSWMWSSWVLNTSLYYSSQERNLMCLNSSRGKSWSFYSLKKDNNNVTVLENVKNTRLSYVEKAFKIEKRTVKKGYYMNDKLTSKAAVEKKIKSLMSGKVKLTTKIKNTEENRNKYLTLEYAR